MARIAIQTKEESPKSLQILIDDYGEKNDRCNALKKSVANLNSKLKEYIHKVDKCNSEILTDNYKCTLSITEDVQVNEEKLIKVLKKYDVPVIKTKEYVDADALERLIYAEKLDNEILLAIDACNTKVTKETLRVKKLKGETKDE